MSKVKTCYFGMSFSSPFCLQLPVTLLSEVAFVPVARLFETGDGISFPFSLSFSYQREPLVFRKRKAAFESQITWVLY